MEVAPPRSHLLSPAARRRHPGLTARPDRRSVLLCTRHQDAWATTVPALLLSASFISRTSSLLHQSTPRSKQASKHINIPSLQKFFFPWLSANRQASTISSLLPTSCIVADQAYSPPFFSTKETPAATAPFAPIFNCISIQSTVAATLKSEIFSVFYSSRHFPVLSTTLMEQQPHNKAVALSTASACAPHLYPPPIHQHSPLGLLLRVWTCPPMMLSTCSMKCAQGLHFFFPFSFHICLLILHSLNCAWHIQVQSSVQIQKQVQLDQYS